MMIQGLVEAAGLIKNDVVEFYDVLTSEWRVVLSIKEDEIYVVPCYGTVADEEGMFESDNIRRVEDEPDIPGILWSEVWDDDEHRYVKTTWRNKPLTMAETPGQILGESGVEVINKGQTRIKNVDLPDKTEAYWDCVLEVEFPNDRTFVAENGVFTRGSY